MAKTDRNGDDAGMHAPPVRWASPSVVVATCLWLGRIPWAPGTWGAVAGVGLAYGITQAALGTASSGAATSLAVELGLIVLINAISIPICTRATAALGGQKDPGAINLDEAASVPLALFVLPLEARGWEAMLVAFVLFRFFDILKPFPCRQLEHLPDGCGIMADDWGAAVWSGCCLLVAFTAGWLPH